MLRNKYLIGHVLDMLPTVPAKIAHCIVTSPPYYHQRYDGGPDQIWSGLVPVGTCRHEWGEPVAWEKQPNRIGCSFFCVRCRAWKGKLGLEPTVELYVAHIRQVAKELWRVLRDDGTFWLNLGDKYVNGVLLGVPWLVINALKADGWYLRTEAIWHKKNPVPSSVDGWRWERHRVKIGNRGRGKEAWRVGSSMGAPQQDHGPDGGFQDDAEWEECPGCEKCDPNGGLVLRKGSWRCTTAHEHMFMLTKSNCYYGDRDAVAEPNTSTMRPNFDGKRGQLPQSEDRANAGGDMLDRAGLNPAGRNLRSVWTLATQAYSGGHFATFPEALVEKPILASTALKNCPKCGAPWARVVARHKPTKQDVGGKLAEIKKSGFRNDGNTRMGDPISKTLGFRPTCECCDNDGSGEATVVDPFMGSGTVAAVCAKFHRSWFAVDVNPDCRLMLDERIAETQPVLPFL